MTTPNTINNFEFPMIASLGITPDNFKSVGYVELRKARTLTVTIKGTTAAEATSGLQLNMYFSPTGNDWDTVPFATFNLNLLAGFKTQETHNIDAPEHGQMKFTVVNLDSAQSASDVQVWASIRRWSGV